MAEVVSSKGCSRLFVGLSSPLSSFRSAQPFDQMSLDSSSLVSETAKPLSNGPFTGLLICVTGLSKEARKQVMEATERLGGRYSPNLHPQCTHLVVQIVGGRKFDHAMKHGSRNGLFVVTIGWFVDSVRRNVRMNESQYNIKGVEENGLKSVRFSAGSENSCFPTVTHGGNQFGVIGEQHATTVERECDKNNDSILNGQSLYIDKNIPLELRNKVAETAAREGASMVDQWFVGCSTSHVVCEGTSMQKYFGHSTNLVTPLWVLKTAKEKRVQKLVHVSADLARHVSMKLENYQNNTSGEVINKENYIEDAENFRRKTTQADREKIVNFAKIGVRNRRSHRMQTCQIPIRPITSGSLMDSVCWTISEPTSSASIYTDSFSCEDVSENHTNLFFDAKADEKDSFANLTRPLTESEKSEIILKINFLTILFPVDRFSEMGPSSRTFFGKNGFTVLQVLDHIHAFYQENMSMNEVEAAIHTDSRHADRLRAVYSSRATSVEGYVSLKRIDFLGSRRSFERLKRVSGDNNGNLYELLIRA